jgi:hypothetical protein
MAAEASGAAVALDALELLADAAGFLGAVPDADDLDLVALVDLGPQGLAEAAALLAMTPDAAPRMWGVER